jgi:hypothetical protein
MSSAENTKLKRIAADQMLDVSAMQGLLGNAGRPCQSRAVGFLMNELVSSRKGSGRIVDPCSSTRLRRRTDGAVTPASRAVEVRARP